MKDQLVALATIWSDASGRSLAALSTQVTQDSGLFRRLGNNGRLTTDTLEKFLHFFRDGDNWGGGVIPAAAADLLDNFENIANAAAASTVKCAIDSSENGDADARLERDAA